VNTGTARIVIIVALVVVGGLLLANAFGDSGVAAAGGPSGAVTSPTPSSTSSPTGTQSTQTPPPTPDPQPPKDVAVAVFNGTNTQGLAGVVLENLIGHGYQQGMIPSDAPNKPVAKTVVYYTGSGADAEQNKSNATALADKYYPDAKVQELDEVYSQDGTVAKGVQVVVVIGENDQPAA
jgi:hypothetical protein